MDFYYCNRFMSAVLPVIDVVVVVTAVAIVVVLADIVIVVLVIRAVVAVPVVVEVLLLVIVAVVVVACHYCNCGRYSALHCHRPRYCFSCCANNYRVIAFMNGCFPQ